MKDERGANPLTVTGAPTLVSGALTFDTDQALEFSSGKSFSASDSAGLSPTGSFSIELFIKLTGTPGANTNVVLKNGSYAIAVRTDRKLEFTVIGGATTTLVSNTALTVGTWYHVVVVCNQNYNGTARFGLTSIGGAGIGLNGETAKGGASTGLRNKWVSTFTPVEAGLATKITMALARDDETWPLQLRAVVYSDSGSVPSALIANSSEIIVPSPSVRPPSYNWYEFPLSSPGVFNAGAVWIGYQMGYTSGQGWIPYNATGQAYSTADSFADVSSTFGTPTSEGAKTLSVYCDYTPIARTGLEGKLLVYLNGQQDNSAAHTTGVTDTANALVIGNLTQLDDVSFWNRALTPVEVGTHYTAH